MATSLPPPPTNDQTGSYAWLEWFRQLRAYITVTGSVPWSIINFAGSNITDIAARSHQSLQSLQGGTTGQYYHLTSSEYTGTGTGVFVRKDTPKFSSNIVLPKTTGVGIKIDESTPTFGWSIVPGRLVSRGAGATDPNLATYSGNIKQFQYDVNDETWTEFHVPYDYVPNTDLYLSLHWSLDTAGITEDITWSIDVTYASDDNSSAFGTPVNLSVTDTSSTTQYHLTCSEIQLTGSGRLTLADIKVGGVILLRVYLSANTGATKPFLHIANIAYQSKVTGTKTRDDPYYT